MITIQIHGCINIKWGERDRDNPYAPRILKIVTKDYGEQEIALFPVRPDTSKDAEPAVA